MLSIKNYLEGVQEYELTPNTSQKNFYGKAKVIETSEGKYLKSYNTIIVCIKNDGSMVRYWGGWSSTTSKHIKAFSGLNKKEYFDIPMEMTPQEQARLYSGAIGWQS